MDERNNKRFFLFKYAALYRRKVSTRAVSLSPTVQFHTVKTRIYSWRIRHVRADDVIAFRGDYNVSVSHSTRSLTERAGKNIDLPKRGFI